MRKQIAAANWKMNKTYQDGKELLESIVNGIENLSSDQQVIFAVPFPYLMESNKSINNKQNVFVAAQNCHHKMSGAYTGEVSVDMLNSIGINFCIVGHSERREYFHESNAELAEKVDLCLSKSITPIFCCGEPLNIREEGIQNSLLKTIE